MARYGGAFGRGLALGAGAVLLYAATRQTSAVARRLEQRFRASQADGQPTLIDWDTVIQVAERAAGRVPTTHPSAREQLQVEYTSLLEEIQRPLADYTGTSLPPDAIRAEVFDRGEWIRANVANFRELLQPVEEFYRDNIRSGRGSSTGTSAAQAAAQLVLSAEMGLLVGYLSRKVLGQYDISLLAEEAPTGGRLYFVEPNLRNLERILSIPRDELRRWVAVHEATHAFEFEAHPWVRPYLQSSLRTYLRLLLSDLGARPGEVPVASLVTRLVSNLRRGHGLIAAVQTPEQRLLMGRLQALMSLAEGYSNHVMNAVGRQILPNFDLIHHRVEERQRRRGSLDQLFLRLTGLSMKMEQYKVGEQFVDAVVKMRGLPFANRAWQAAENLPTEEELRSPEAWVRRMERQTA